MGNTNPNFLNGIPEMLVLHLLSERDMYGYELVKAIQARSNDAFHFGEGCIYPILHYLEKTKLLNSERRDVGGRSRNYYALTPKGEKRLAELRGEWREVAAGVATILGGRHA
jgi:PadR family transcriptional regulator, regulatory protein PadR